MTTSFQQNAIVQNGKRYKVWYSANAARTALTIYSRGYTTFKGILGLAVYNESDLMTDYFEEDKIVLGKGNKNFEAAMKAHDAKHKIVK